VKIQHLALLLLIAPGTAYAAPGERSADYLTPRVKVGDRLDSIFSKATAITGQGFAPIVMRVSGTASDRIAAVSTDLIAEEEQYLYDGRPGGSDRVEVRDHGRTNCVDGKCLTNDQTSAPLFNPFLWGAIPDRIAVGSTWRGAIAKPWEIGPAGEERVAVTRLDRAGGSITLVREGEGAGPTSDDASRPTVAVLADGKQLNCRIVPGRSHWIGTATIVQGVTLADEIMVERPVELIADSGEHFTGTQRVYTLFLRAPVPEKI